MVRTQIPFYFQVKFNGISGLVDFGNKTKSRLVERLDIMNVQEEEDEKGNTQPVLVNVGDCNGSVSVYWLLSFTFI